MERVKENNSTIGSRLHGLRRSAKRTLKEECEIFDVSLNSVYRWEHDLSVPKRSLLRRIAEFYGVNYDWLLYGAENEDKPAAEKRDEAENGIERKLLNMLANLSYDSKFRVLGYVERICIEELGERLGCKYLFAHPEVKCYNDLT